MSLNDSRYGYARPDPTLARRRIVAGAILGLIVQVILATVLGLIAVQGGTIGDMFAMGSFSSLVATPACFVAAFALMFSPRTRQLGVGVLVGAICGTLLLMGGCAAFG
ncbi:hypothetical protein AB0I28_24460 [Phytomonospora sp. NPDC050363]|uniref:hypothetical protein n=1 Tax=Phytomonospora sp. NPDC050363 TaxID=3155642 RepID=UPI0033EF26EA